MTERQALMMAMLERLWRVVGVSIIDVDHLINLLAVEFRPQHERCPYDPDALINAKASALWVYEVAVCAGIVGVWDGKVVRCS
jgi:hypothetical protein